MLLPLLISVALASQSPPIPQVPEGIVLGPEDADTVLEVFQDHLCGDCARTFPSFWDFWNEHSDKIQLRLYVNPLPYHWYTEWVSMVGHWIAKNKPEHYIRFHLYMLSNNVKYDSYDDLSYDRFVEYMKTDIPECTAGEVTAQNVTDALTMHSEYDMGTRGSWKYAVSRGVTITPAYFLNGVYLDDAFNYNVPGQWYAFFDDFWAGNYS